jgi:hypothetical protein
MVPTILLANDDANVLNEIDVGAADGDHGEFLVVRDCTVKRLLFTVTSEIPVGTGTAPTVIFKKRPTPLASTDESLMGTLIITTSLAIGQTIFLDVDTDLAVGDSVEISWTIGITGTVAGIGVFSMVCCDKPDEAGNNDELTASIVL